MPEEYTLWINPEGDALDLDNYAKKEYVDAQLGSIETALDAIITIQTNLLGGVEA